MPESFDPALFSRVDLLILLDSADCWCASVPKSTGRLGIAETAFRLEEQLPIDAEDMAIIRSSQNGAHIVTRKTMLQSILAKLQKVQATVHAIIPQALFLAEAYGQTMDVSRVLIKQGTEKNDLEFDRGQLVAWNLFFEQGSPKIQKDFDWIYCTADAENLFASEVQDRDRQNQQTKTNTVTLLGYARQIAEGKALSRFSFLPGLREEPAWPVEFGARILLGIFLAFLIFLNFCLWVGRNRYTQITHHAVQKRAAIFRTVFPKNRRLVDAEKQLNVHVQKQRSYSEVVSSIEHDSGLTVLAELLNLLSNPEQGNDSARQEVNIGVEQIRVAGEQVILKGSCPDPRIVESLRSRLKAEPNLNSNWQLDSGTGRYVLTLRFSDGSAFRTKAKK